MGARRLFFALWPDAPTAARLHEAGQSLALPGGRAPPEADLHLTLCFLGAVEAPLEAALCERAAAVLAPPFELDFDRLEYWRRSRVLVATCSQPSAVAEALASELRACAQRVGLTPEERPFQAHVTLLRGLGAAPALAQAARLPAPLRWSVHSFYLAQSQELEPAIASQATRARYRPLSAWPLRSAPR